MEQSTPHQFAVDGIQTQAHQIGLTGPNSVLQVNTNYPKPT